MKLKLSLILGSVVISSCGTPAPKNSTIIADTTAKVEKVAVDHNRHYQNPLNQTARIIAGMSTPTDTLYQAVRESQHWKSYAKESASVWQAYDERSKNLYQWVDNEVLPNTATLKTVFYPFSGPDFLYGNLIFPNAETIYMLGLEDIGSVPDFSKITTEEIDEYIAFYKRSISEVLEGSFYHTNNMKNYLHNAKIDGVTPVLMLFLAQRGKQISAVNFIIIDKEGTMQTVENDAAFKKTTARGVEIKYYNGADDIERKIYFFTGNVADGGLGENPAYDKFYRSLRPEGAFIKSATYLMHKSYFSVIRNVLLDNCKVIIQDDSGIAYKYYDPKSWNIQLYGTYRQPINLFSNLYEEDLFRAYKESTTVKPINFRIGYSNPSNVRIATKK